MALVLCSWAGSSQGKNCMRSSFLRALGKKKTKEKQQQKKTLGTQIVFMHLHPKMFIWFLLATRFTTLYSPGTRCSYYWLITVPPPHLIITFPDVYMSKSRSMLILSNYSGRFTVVLLQARIIFSWRHHSFENPQQRIEVCNKQRNKRSLKESRSF